ALARGHLAGHRTIDGVFSVRDRGNMNNRLLRNRSHITGELTERPFNVGFSRIYLPFDHDFGIGGNEAIEYGLFFGLPLPFPHSPPPLSFLHPPPPPHPPLQFRPWPRADSQSPHTGRPDGRR